MYFTYVLLSEVIDKSYVGITDNKERRLKQHNKGLHIYTKRYVPWKLIYSEGYQTRLEARKREKYFKSSSGRKWLKRHIFNADVAELVYAQS